ncbi:hypothetical protein MO408_07200 [Klebsiella pneumoniae]|nr:hypothetical protein MO408_07200 [Klebsiella pneumoniae]
MLEQMPELARQIADGWGFRLTSSVS